MTQRYPSDNLGAGGVLAFGSLCSSAAPAPKDVMTPASRVAIVALLLAAAGGGFYWWKHHQPQAVRTAVSPPAPAAPVPPRPVPPLPAPAPPAIRHPLATAGQTKEALPEPGQADAYLKKALLDLVGSKAVRAFFHVDDLARRWVATIDNLGTEHAPADLWPVKVTPGSFVVDTSTDGKGTVVGAHNADRYSALVRLVEATSTEKIVSLYVRLYPLFQQAHEELGYPGKYFNDRVVQVIDDLLATPAVAGPVKVKLARVEGATPPPGGAGLYLFEDPELERRSAGQKILLRVGPDNAAKLKSKLAEIRRQIVGQHGGTLSPRL